MVAGVHLVAAARAFRPPLPGRSCRGRSCVSSSNLRTYWERSQRKGDPLDPRDLTVAELAGLLSGVPAGLATIEAHIEQHPELWELDPRDLMRELALLPGVGKGTSAWWVLNEIQIGRRLAEARAS